MLKSLLLAASVGLGGLLPATAATAAPQIASGDLFLEMDFDACLATAGAYLATLGGQAGGGEVYRTATFADSVLQILCYEAGAASLAVFFAAHDSSLEGARGLVRGAFETLAAE